MQSAEVHTLFPDIIDPVFFRKSDVKIGTELTHCGRLNSRRGTTWRVTRIWTFRRVNGHYKSKRVDAPQRLSDALELRQVGGKDILELSFQYLSYSAIWRLVA